MRDSAGVPAGSLCCRSHLDSQLGASDLPTEGQGTTGGDGSPSRGMAGFLERPAAALERRSRPRRCGCGLGLLEQCRRRGPRSSARRSRGTQGQVGQVPYTTTGHHCHSGPPGQA
eukprot:4561268-Amphidinium_carterae.1